MTPEPSNSNAGLSELDSYSERRASFLDAFKEKQLVEESVRVDLSPSGRYALETSGYTSGAETWNYSRGAVTEIASGRIIADVLFRADFCEVAEGWVSNDEFRYTVEDPAYEDDPRPPILPAVWKRPA